MHSVYNSNFVLMWIHLILFWNSIETVGIL
jgi:hypothetical protein